MTFCELVIMFLPYCCYPIFDPCFDKFSEKNKNSKKNNENPKNAFLIYLHRF